MGDIYIIKWLIVNLVYNKKVGSVKASMVVNAVAGSIAT